MFARMAEAVLRHAGLPQVGYGSVQGAGHCPGALSSCRPDKPLPASRPLGRLGVEGLCRCRPFGELGNGASVSLRRDQPSTRARSELSPIFFVAQRSVSMAENVEVANRGSSCDRYTPTALRSPRLFTPRNGVEIAGRDRRAVRKQSHLYLARSRTGCEPAVSLFILRRDPHRLCSQKHEGNAQACRLTGKP